MMKKKENVSTGLDNGIRSMNMPSIEGMSQEAEAQTTVREFKFDAIYVFSDRYVQRVVRCRHRSAY